MSGLSVSERWRGHDEGDCPPIGSVEVAGHFSFVSSSYLLPLIEQVIAEA